MRSSRLSVALLVAAIAIFVLLAEGAAWLHYGLTAVLLVGAGATYLAARQRPEL